MRYNLQGPGDQRNHENPGGERGHGLPRNQHRRADEEDLEKLDDGLGPRATAGRDMGNGQFNYRLSVAVSGR